MIYYEENTIHLKFKTDSTVFSPSNIDNGTLSMLSLVKFDENDKILDLGCGYGFVGIYASQFIPVEQIVMSDISDNALNLAKYNIAINDAEGIKIIKSNGLDNIEDNDFSIILSNPPYHEDFSIPKNFIESGYKKLKYGGKIYMVTKRKKWYKNKLISVFGGVKITELNGYYIFVAEKRENYQKKNKNNDKNHLSKRSKTVTVLPNTRALDTRRIIRQCFFASKLLCGKSKLSKPLHEKQIFYYNIRLPPVSAY